ncbi:MAG: hypothetical protein AB8G05_12105 [Oligoflexales bacterium]
MSTANAYWNRTKLIINTFWFIVCMAIFSNTLHAEQQVTDSISVEEQAVESTSLAEGVDSTPAAEDIESPSQEENNISTPVVEEDNESTSTEEEAIESPPEEKQVKRTQPAEKLRTNELKAYMIKSESDLENVKRYEESLKPEQRVYQGVLNFESKLGTKILDILLAPNKPKNTVFRQAATVLIAPHYYYWQDED